MIDLTNLSFFLSVMHRFACGAAAHDPGASCSAPVAAGTDEGFKFHHKITNLWVQDDFNLRAPRAAS